ncbi:MAG TPA: ACP S-malonyltransferase [Anaerolineae bacterium]|nr:ACP S-malonyltransferase [Anaerolineae bacterium]
MKKIAFLYPGQGSQSVGMGISVAEHFPGAASIFKRASACAGYDILSLCAEGPEEKLSRTLYTQPALYTVEAAITDVLKAKDIHPVCTAGHSLGEFSAWYNADVFGFEEGFELVSERARIMDNVNPDSNGIMCAIIGLTQDAVEEACNAVDGMVVVANMNSPLQMVISGEKDAVEKAGLILKEKGAKYILTLKVSGAFHSPLMKNAQKEFARIVMNTKICDAKIPVYSNVSGKPITDTDTIRNAIIDHLTSPVRWLETVSNMIRDGVEEAYEIGPGNVLAGLARRIDGSLSVRTISEYSQIKELVNEKT